MEFNIPQPINYFSKAGKNTLLKPKKASLLDSSLPPLQVPERSRQQSEPFSRMLPRISKVQFQGADRFYDVRRGAKCKGLIQLRRMASRRPQKVDPQFRVYIDPSKNYDRSKLGFVDMNRQTQRSSDYLIKESYYKENPETLCSSRKSRSQSVAKDDRAKLAGPSFEKQLERDHFYRQQVNDCFYAPNFQAVKESLGRVGMKFQKQSRRKELAGRSNCQIENDRFDYEGSKHLIYPKRDSHIDFGTMQGRVSLPER